MMSPKELPANPKNWRKHPKAQQDGLTGVLSDVGWVQSIVFNQRTGRLIDGHLRVELALKNGEPEVPVTVVDLTQEEEDAILASFDPISAMAKTNHEALAALIANIKTTNPDFKDLIDRIRGRIEGKDGGEPDVPAPDPIVKRGDVWQLGHHRVICGDSTDPEVWDRLLGDVHAELCFTSPPYNVGYLGMPGLKGTSKKYINDEDETGTDEYLEFLKKFTQCAIENCDDVLVNIGLVSGNRRAVIRYLDIFIDSFKDILYWVKDTAAPHINEGTVNNRVEPIYAFGDGKRAFRHPNFQQGTFWNVIEGPNASGNKASEIHKATFPLYLPESIISAFSRSGNSVVDPFLGTGTTLIAAEKQGRKCFGIELEPAYCDYTIKRWEIETGGKAKKL